MIRHGKACYYSNHEVKDGDWEKCTCINKIYRGELDREQADRHMQKET